MTRKPYGYATEARLVMDGVGFRPLIARQRIVDTKKQADICADKWKTEKWSQDHKNGAIITRVEIRVVTLYEAET